MVTDNAIWIYSMLKNKGAYFSRVIMGDKVYYLAVNRAARRFLDSNTIRGIAKKNGNTIEDYSIC